MSFTFSISEGKFTEGENTWEKQLYPLSLDDKRQVCRILKDIKKIVRPTYPYELDGAIKRYQENLARGAQEKRLCDYLWNLINARCYPYLGYSSWLGQDRFGIHVSKENYDKYQDAQLRWIDALIEEFSSSSS